MESCFIKCHLRKRQCFIPFIDWQKIFLKNQAFGIFHRFGIFGTTNTSVLRFPWTVSTEPVGYPGSTSTKSVLYEFFKVFNDNQTLMAKNKHLGKKKHTWKEKTKEKWKSPSNIKNLIFNRDKCTDSYMYIYDNMGLS